MSTKEILTRVYLSFVGTLANGSTIQSSNMDPTKMDWTEMSEMSSPNSGKHPSYKRTGSKDSMEVIFLIEKGNFEFSSCTSYLIWTSCWVK